MNTHLALIGHCAMNINLISLQQGKIMANFLLEQKHLDAGDIAHLKCDTQCNFMLMDNTNFQNYRTGRQFKYYGGHYTHFPARITAPHTGTWNVVIDLGGGRANIQYNLSYLTSA